MTKNIPQRTAQRKQVICHLTTGKVQGSYFIVNLCPSSFTISLIKTQNSKQKARTCKMRWKEYWICQIQTVNSFTCVLSSQLSASLRVIKTTMLLILLLWKFIEPIAFWVPAHQGVVWGTWGLITIRCCLVSLRSHRGWNWSLTPKPIHPLDHPQPMRVKKLIQIFQIHLLGTDHFKKE